MILQEMELKLKVTWLDPEGADKEKRRQAVAERLLKMFTHEFGEATVDKHGVKIELIDIQPL